MSDPNGEPDSKRTRRPGPPAAFSAARGAILVAVAVILGIVLLQAIDDGNSGPIGDGGSTSSTTASTSSTTAAPGGAGSSTSSTTSAKSTTLPPAQVTVRVLNGSGLQGVATTTTNTLKSKGYKTLVASNAPLRKGTIVYFKAGRNAECKGVSSLVPSSTVGPVPTPVPGGQDADCIVVLGS